MRWNRDVLQTCLPSETGFPGRFFKQTVEAGVSASSAGRVLGTFAPHLLLPTGILRNQMESQPNIVRELGVLRTQAPGMKSEIAHAIEEGLAKCTYEGLC
jgi:hypothetical protein